VLDAEPAQVLYAEPAQVLDAVREFLGERLPEAEAAGLLKRLEVIGSQE